MFGQVFFPRWRIFLVATVGCAGGLLLLVACMAGAGDRVLSGAMLPLSGPEGRWTGRVTPRVADCGMETTGLMSIEGNRFAFAPFQSITALHGTVSASGEVIGEDPRSVPGGRSLTIRFAGRIEHSKGAEAIAGDLTSGRCAWSVNLTRD